MFCQKFSGERCSVQLWQWIEKENVYEAGAQRDDSDNLTSERSIFHLEIPPHLPSAPDNFQNISAITKQVLGFQIYIKKSKQKGQ